MLLEDRANLKAALLKTLQDKCIWAILNMVIFIDIAPRKR